MIYRQHLNIVRFVRLLKLFHHLRYPCLVQYFVRFGPRFVKFPKFPAKKISFSFIEILGWCLKLFLFRNRSYLSDNFQIFFLFSKRCLSSFSFKLFTFCFSTHYKSIIWLWVLLVTAELQQFFESLLILIQDLCLRPSVLLAAFNRYVLELYFFLLEQLFRRAI